MQTHSNADAAVGLHKMFEISPQQQARRDELERKAREMVASGRSTITAGEQGEVALGTLATPHGFVTQLPDDPLALRISIGEGSNLEGSRYVVFRGDPAECLDLLERAVVALRLYAGGKRS